MTEKNFEDVFKDKLSHFEADVNPSVWQSVQSGLAGKGAAVSGASGASQAAGTFAGLGAKGMLWIAGAALVAGTGLYAILSTDAPVTKTEPAENSIVTEKPVETTITDNQQVAPTVSTQNEVPEKKNEVVYAANKIPATSVNTDVPQNTAAEPVATASTQTASTDLQKKAEPPATRKADAATVAPAQKTDVPAPVETARQETVAAPKEELVKTTATGEPVFDLIENHLLGTQNGDVKLPNNFTPDGDGYNDVFTLRTTGLKSLEVTIFLHGTPVMKWNTLDGSWNGRLPNGKEAQAGTYHYSVKAVTSEDKICIAQSILILSR